MRRARPPDDAQDARDRALAADRALRPRDGRSRCPPRVGRALLAAHRPPAAARCDGVDASRTTARACSSRRLVARRDAALPRARGCPVAVDPKTISPPYRGAALLKPNLREAETLAGCRDPHAATTSTRAVARLRRRIGGGAVVVTRGADGMSLFESDGPGRRRARRAAREVFDVQGAGDTSDRRARARAARGRDAARGGGDRERRGRRRGRQGRHRDGERGRAARARCPRRSRAAQGGRVIRSMTGFGRAASRSTARRFEVEVRSVNHRHLDARIRLPRRSRPSSPTCARAIQAPLRARQGRSARSPRRAARRRAPRLEIDLAAARAVSARGARALRGDGRRARRARHARRCSRCRAWRA